MWILDAKHRDGMELWVKDNGTRIRRESYRPNFLLHLPDKHENHLMIDALESRYGAEECIFRTIYGPLNGYRIYADREVAEAIERQSNFSAKLFNVDVRTEQRFMAEKGIFPCGEKDDSRFDLDFEMPISSLGIEIEGDIRFADEITSLKISDGRESRMTGDEKTVLSDLLAAVDAYDPDLILMPEADFWTHLIVRKARGYGLDLSLSRNGRFSRLGEKSYWSYGKVNHRPGALLPEGRVLIDTAESYTFIEGGLRGVLLASRLTGLAPNLTSRFTPGTLVSSYESYEAVKSGIAVPFRKGDPERTRKFDELRKADRGGMMFQPEPGVYENIYQLDFTSLYPSIIVKHNLSPETIASPDKRGFLSGVLAPLLELRVRTKELKKSDDGYSKLDSILKWMLVTSFGYTGYRNAKFGSIEVHESITRIARENLVEVKRIAEEMGFDVLHGIVDCVWVRGERVEEFKERVEREMGIPTEIESYDWIVFLPMADGNGAYNRYYGRLCDGSIKTRGIALNRRDTPEYIRSMQNDALSVMREARSVEELRCCRPRVKDIYETYSNGLRRADVKDLVIDCRISNEEYEKNCPQRAALHAYRRSGVEISPGMNVRYVVRDSKKWIVDPEFKAGEFDADHYLRLIRKAWQEIEFAIGYSEGKKASRGHDDVIRAFR